MERLLTILREPRLQLQVLLDSTKKPGSVLYQVILCSVYLLLIDPVDKKIPNKPILENEIIIPTLGRVKLHPSSDEDLNLSLVGRNLSTLTHNLCLGKTKDVIINVQMKTDKIRIILLETPPNPYLFGTILGNTLKIKSLMEIILHITLVIQPGTDTLIQILQRKDMLVIYGKLLAHRNLLMESVRRHKNNNEEFCL